MGDTVSGAEQSAPAIVEAASEVAADAATVVRAAEASVAIAADGAVATMQASEQAMQDANAAAVLLEQTRQDVTMDAANSIRANDDRLTGIEGELQTWQQATAERLSTIEQSLSTVLETLLTMATPEPQPNTPEQSTQPEYLIPETEVQPVVNEEAGGPKESPEEPAAVVVVAETLPPAAPPKRRRRYL